MTETSTSREMLMDVVRTLIKAAGGILITKGWIDASGLATLAGAGALLFGLAWSWVSTYWLTDRVH